MENQQRQHTEKVDYYKRLNGLKSSIFLHHRPQSIWILYLHCVRQHLSQTEIAQKLNLNLADMRVMYELFCEMQQKQARH